MTELTVFYDGQCPLCLREMRSLKKHDEHQAITLIDINTEGFEQTYPHIDPVAASNVLHAETKDGKLLLGLDVTAKVWETVGAHRWVAALRWPVIRPVADLGYKIFAKNRYRFSYLLTGQARCASCQIK